MNCPRCGADAGTNLRFCTECGAPINVAENVIDTVNEQNDSHWYRRVCRHRAVESIVMGIVGIATSIFGFPGLFFGTIGLIKALILRKVQRNTKAARTGLILNIISLANGTLMIILFFVLTLVNR